MLVGLAHLNFHVLGGADFDWKRLILPAALGIALGLLLIRDIARHRQLQRAAADLTGARDDALRIAEERQALLLRAERQLAQLRREQASALLAFGAVHDLRNVLVPIIASADLLDDDVTLAPELAGELRTAGERGNQLCNRVLDVLRGDIPFAAPVDIVDALTEAVDLATRLLPDQMQVSCDLVSAAVRVNREDLLQITHNLLTNSSNARRGGLQVRVEGAAMGDRYQITFLDNGPGLPPGFEMNAEPGANDLDAELHGVGLRLVEVLASRNGGRFDIRDVEGGVLAMVELPRMPD